MTELIDAYTVTRQPTGKKYPKSVIHSEGHYHHTVHVWLYTDQSEILLQQRALTKEICPGLWDVSAAGHVDAGEAIKDAARRETKEELGYHLKDDDLKLIGVFNCFQSYENGIKDFEFHNTFIAKLQAPITTLNFQKEEVQAIKLVTIHQFEQFLNTIGEHNHFVKSNRDYYYQVLEAIKLHLKQ